MSIGERVPARQRSARLPRQGEMVRLGMIALAIVLLHVLAASLLLPSSSHGPIAPLEDAKSSAID